MLNCWRGLADLGDGKRDEAWRPYTSSGGVYVTLTTDSQGIIGELEVLQNDLLARLDDLNYRVEAVIKEWTTDRKVEDATDPDALDGAVSN